MKLRKNRQTAKPSNLSPELREMLESLKGAPCAGCGAEVSFPPPLMSIWITPRLQRKIPYLLCKRCADRFGDKELALEIEARLSRHLAGCSN